MTDDGRPLAGRTIAVTAERRHEDQMRLFAARGATVLHAPTMHTVDLSGDHELRHRTETVIAEPPDWTVATTGFGMRLWFEAADAWDLGDDLRAALRRGRVVARGPKAQSVCRQHGLEVAWSAPRESMPEVVGWLADQPDIDRQRLVVQLFDPEDHPSTEQLRAIAHGVSEVPIYRWQRPHDTAPALDLARRIAERTVDAVTFTSQPAVRYLVELAGEAGLGERVVEAFNDGSVLPVCVGPVCAQAGAAAGITTMVWPEPFRLVPMVKLAEARLARADTFAAMTANSSEMGYVADIETATLDNGHFRRVLFTGQQLQLTVMSIPPGGEVGLEMHEGLDQFIRIEAGSAKVTMGRSREQLDEVHEVEDDWVAIIPGGTWHNVENTGEEPLKLYSLYSPPEHADGTVHETKADSDADEHDH